MNIPKYQHVKAAIDQSGNRLFSVIFRKRGTGEIRRMTCRKNVKKYLVGGSLPYKPKAYNLITVFDVNAPAPKNRSSDEPDKGDYRMIPVEGIEQITIEGKTYNFDVPADYIKKNVKVIKNKSKT